MPTGSRLGHGLPGLVVQVVPALSCPPGTDQYRAYRVHG